MALRHSAARAGRAAPRTSGAGAPDPLPAAAGPSGRAAEAAAGRAIGVGERGQSRGCDAGLRRLVAELDLDADGERRQRVRPLRGEPLGDPQPVERVHPVKERRRLARLVGLQRADEVAAEGTAGERPEMRARFLQVVLAEVGKARVK